jgi:hypothetical protein
MTPATIRRWYLVAAAAIAVMTSIYATWSYFNGMAPAEEVLQLYGVFMGILVVSWLVTDPRIPAAQRPSFDHGALIWATFPFLAAYHMYLAHRWRGIFIVLGLVGLLAAPTIALAFAYAVG